MRIGLIAAMSLTTIWLVASAAAVTSAASPRELGISGSTNANPSIAASGRLAAVAWGATAKDGPTDVYIAVSHDAGQTFAPAVRVSDAGSRATLSGEQPPRIALVSRRDLAPALVVVWTSKDGDGTRLMSARSNDQGRTFSRPVPVPGTDAAGNRGWESIAADRDGRVVAVWLDHRDAMTGAHMSHQAGAHVEAPADGVARAQRSKLFFGRLGDAAAVRPIAAGVCYCCKTALTTGPDGAIYAAWRHVYPGNLRDIAFAMSRDGGRTFTDPVRVSEDKWELDGCPENGPAIAVDPSSRVHIVWPTLTTENGQETLALFYATSRDGRTFSKRVRIPTAGAAFHPQLVLTRKGTLLVAWDEATQGGRKVRFARGTPDDGADIVFTPIAATETVRGSYPAIAATTDGAVAAWMNTGAADSRITVAAVH
jgi:hypothetical protein